MLFIILITIPAFVLCSCSDFINSANSQSTTQAANSTAPTKPKADTKKFDGYSYNHMDKNLRELYEKIDEFSDKKLKVEFSVDGILSERQLIEGLIAYKNDHPEKFWLKDTYEYFYEDGKTLLYLSFSMSGTDLIDAKKLFNRTVDKIVQNAPKNASEYELELYVNNYIIQNCSYDTEAAKSKEVVANENNAYGVLIDKKAVCSGYSQAFQLLCNRLGLDCVSIFGEAENTAHQWNCVMIDNEWYHIDTTWNDADDEHIINVNDYFNLSDNIICKDHTVNPLFGDIDTNSDDCINLNIFVPKCSSMEYNYYRQSCVTLNDLDDSQELVDALANAAANDEKIFSFVISDELDYNYTADLIINDGYMVQWFDSANLKNWYSPKISTETLIYTKENLRVLTLELKYD